MGFLRTLFWVAVTVVVVVFSMRNWVRQDVRLFGDLIVTTSLPVIMLIAFLLGFVPVYAWHRATRWRYKKQSDADRIPTAQPPQEPAPYQAPTPGIEPAQAD